MAIHGLPWTCAPGHPWISMDIHGQNEFDSPKQVSHIKSSWNDKAAGYAAVKCGINYVINFIVLVLYVY